MWGASAVCIRPILYLLYTSPVGDIVRRYNMGFHIHASDTLLYLSFDSCGGEVEAAAASQIEASTCEIEN